MRLLFYASLLLVSVFGFWVGVVFIKLPSTANLNRCFVAQMHKVHYCPRSKNWISLKNIPQGLIDSILISEDSRFYHHGGIDFREIYESLKVNIRSAKYARGGSTITQQLARNLYLTSEKTLVRKAREMILALRIEQRLKKAQILERYLNIVKFGKSVYGLKAAAEFYFAKRPQQLTLFESIFLAHVLPSPNKYGARYVANRTLSKYSTWRMKDILQKLHRYKKISQPQYDETLAELNLNLSKSKNE